MSDGKGNFNFTLIIVVVLSVLLATGSSYFMFSRLIDGNNRVTNEVSSEARELGPTTDIGGFLVNLADGRRFIKVSIVLEVDDSKVIREIADRTPQVRDSIISILRNKEQSQIVSEVEVRSLRTEIMKDINSKLIDGQITNVFFTEFVVQ